MRVISGIRRGLKLKAPPGLDTRPTEDRVKESVYNMLGQSFNDVVVLDLFCGSGANGIEFISRGARKAYFVDKSKDAIKTLEYNLSRAKFEDSAIIIEDYMNKAIKKLDEKFDFIYMDPPFDRMDLYKKALNLINEYKILKPDGKIIIEYKSENKLVMISGFKELKNKKYGNTSIAIWGWDVNEGNLCG